MQTQLQLRILASAKNNRGYDCHTHFFDLKGYRDTPFLEKGSLEEGVLSESQVKSGKSYEEISDALQSRLAYMEFEDTLMESIKDYQQNSSLFKKAYEIAKITWIQMRNARLRSKAVSKAVKRNGGWSRAVLTKYIPSSYLINFLESQKD